MMLADPDSDPYADVMGNFKVVRKAIVSCHDVDFLEQLKEDYATEIEKIRSFIPPDDGLQCNNLYNELIELFYSMKQQFEQLNKFEGHIYESSTTD